MLHSLPNELLLEILSQIVAGIPSAQIPSALQPIAQTSPALAAQTREYRGGLLRSRIARIPNISSLMRIWTPPTFFRSTGSSWQSNGGYISQPQDLLNLLNDEQLFASIDAYLTSLERKTQTLSALTSYISLHLPQWPHSTIEQCLLQLWRAQAFYAHDIDRIWSAPASPGEHILRQEARAGFAMGMMDAAVEGLVAVYDVLDRLVRPHGTGQDWLFRVIVREGMEVVLGRLGG